MFAQYLKKAAPTAKSPLEISVNMSSSIDSMPVEQTFEQPSFVESPILSKVNQSKTFERLQSPAKEMNDFRQWFENVRTEHMECLRVAEEELLRTIKSN